MRLLWGENGPKHADAWASFEDMDGATKVTLGMVFATSAEFEEAKGFGAVELGHQTLGKLERFVTSRLTCDGFPRSGWPITRNHPSRPVDDAIGRP